MRELRVNETIRGALPPLRKNDNHTTSSALHDVEFTGPMREWTDFITEVLTTDQANKWTLTIVDCELSSRDIHKEKVFVGDENGLQGRFQQSVGQVVGAALEAEFINISFGDFKTAGVVYRGTPDCIMVLDENTPILEIKAVGELKVPWVAVHNLEKGFKRDDRRRGLLGQLAEYMYDLKVKYGWMSTYEDTVLLRQVKAEGIWYLEYSPVVKYTTSYLPSNNSGIPSLRQCFFHLASVAKSQGEVVNTTKKSR